jgi:SAM-dependent methyltransferase
MSEPVFLEQELRSSRMRYQLAIPFCLGKNVYDFGCGSGRGSYLLSFYAEDVLAYDSNAAAIKVAADKFHRHNIRFFDTPPKPEHLEDRDIVVLIEVFEHLDKDLALSHLARFNRVIPSVFCTTPNGDWLHYRPESPQDRVGMHKWHYTEKELKEVFSLYYEFVVVTGHGFDRAAGRYNGHSVFASNDVSWDKRWLEEVKPK